MHLCNTHIRSWSSACDCGQTVGGLWAEGFSDDKQWAGRQWAEGFSNFRQWVGRQWAEGFSDFRQWAGRQWAEGFSDFRQWAEGFMILGSGQAGSGQGKDGSNN